MKSSLILPITFAILFTLGVGAASEAADDMRRQQAEARETLQQLKAKAAAEEEAARGEAAQSREKIAADRAALEQAVRQLEEQTASLERKVSSLDEEEKRLAEQEKGLLAQLAATDAMVRELVGVLRIHAKDLQSLLAGSLQSAFGDQAGPALSAIAEQAQFPGMEEIAAMNAALRRQLGDGGAVRITRGPIVDRSGNAVEAEILVLGNFTAAYRLGDEVGFLNYSPAGRKLFALSRLPSRAQQKMIRDYMDGKSEAVVIDVTRGAALGQMTRTPTFWQQVQSGGPLVWPILAIFAIASLLIAERLVFLLRNRQNAHLLFESLAAMAERGDWQACRDQCFKLAGKPLARVLAAGIDHCQGGRDLMENGLQEAILREIPPMERFLSSLAMLAAIAPLLGLLGTVTGMIDTFHVITQYGTGDPRMMSGGISVALVTTMLGLGVAIPIMLVHTLLSRAVDNRIAELEEKAVALVNLRFSKGHGSC